MPGTPVGLGPFKGGLHNSSGSGEFIGDDELFSLVNLEVDIDGSLANRPPIREFATRDVGVYLISTFITLDGRKFLVTGNGITGTVNLVNADTGVVAVNNANACGSVAAVQYDDKLWVIPIINLTTGTSSGGYFTSANPPVWVSTPALPRGEAVVVYKERLWVAAGKAPGEPIYQSLIKCAYPVNLSEI